MKTTVTSKLCRNCHATMRLPLWQTKRKDFCSKLCAGAAVRAKTEEKNRRVCLACHKEFSKGSASKGFFCSVSCYQDTCKADKACSDCGQHKATSKTKRCRSCYSKHNRNENHPQWKGALVGYRALHHWVKRNLGTPTTCESCGIEGSGHSMHWANISGEYKRELNDWMRLCPPCHKEYDRERLLV